MKIKKHILIPLMVLLLFGSMDAMAAIEQAIQVKGKVVDNIGEPVIGANVVVKGTTTGVITSIDGSFVLSISPYRRKHTKTNKHKFLHFSTNLLFCSKDRLKRQSFRKKNLSLFPKYYLP